MKTSKSKRRKTSPSLLFVLFLLLFVFSNSASSQLYKYDYLVQAKSAIRGKDFQEADRFLEKFKESKEDIKDYHYYKCINYLWASQYEKALQHINNALKLDTAEPKFWFYRGFIDYLKDQYRSARASFQRSLDLGGAFQNNYYIGVCNIKLNRQQDAYNQLSLYVKKDDKRGMAWLYHGMANHNLKLIDYALQSYNKALALPLYNEDAYYYVGKLYFDKGQYENSIENYSRYLRSNSNNNHVKYQRGLSYFMNRNYEQAIADFDSYLSQYSNVYYAYNNRGLAKFNLEKYNDAIEDYSKSISVNPNHFEAYYKRAFTKDHIEDYKGAIEDYTLVMKFKPNDHDVYYQRGASYFRMGDKESACKDWSKSIELGGTSGKDVVKYNCDVEE